MKQTAVEWLVEEIEKLTDLKINDEPIIQQAKKMERQQIIDANNRGFRVAKRNIAERADEYYNETFKTK